jgi:tetratricopeptide (TPR) repeat protein
LTKEISELVNTARHAENSGDLAAAFETWTRLASRTRRADFQCQLGRVAAKLEKWADAEKAFAEALTINARFSVAMLLMGSLFLERTDGDQTSNAKSAKVWLSRSLDVDPTAVGWSLLGAAFYRLGEKQAAKRAYRTAIGIDKSYEEAYFNLGILVAEEGNDIEAEDLLRTAIQLDPRFLVAHGRLGLLLQKQGRHLEAESEFKRCVEIDPYDYFSHLYLANTLEIEGRGIEAEQEYRKALKVRPGDEHALKLLAHYLENISRQEEAAELGSHLPLNGSGHEPT